MLITNIETLKGRKIVDVKFNFKSNAELRLTFDDGGILEFKHNSCEGSIRRLVGDYEVWYEADKVVIFP